MGIKMSKNGNKWGNSGSTCYKNPWPLILNGTKNIDKNKFRPVMGATLHICHTFMIIIDLDHKFEETMFPYGSKRKWP